MSLQLAAQHLATKGRGPDTMLVHMAPGEVKSLQALARAHGGTLTTNPDTGLPEAGFLRSILPMVAGAALTATGVGAPMAALMVGGGMAAATGSLRQGLMAGLGAYGGAGLMGSITGAGNAALQAANTMPAVEGVAGAGAGAAPSLAVTPAAVPAISPAAMSSVVTPADANLLNTSFGVEPSALSVAPVSSTPVFPGTSGALGSGTSGIGAVDTTIGSTPKDMSYIMGAPTPGPSVMNSATASGSMPAVVDRSTYPVGQQFSEGLKELGNNPSKFMTMDNLKYGMAAASPMLMAEPEKRAGYDGGGPNPYQYEYNANPTGATPGTAPEPHYFRPQYRRMASGGLSAAASHLGDYSDGGRLLRGPGDGVSDSIPAVIGNKRPARLADGEFVVPARVVSELGNGSTDAGARKLYAMMDRVQKARNKTVGKNKVAVNSRAEKYLPA